MAHRTRSRAALLALGVTACINANNRMQSPLDRPLRGQFFTSAEIRASGRSSLADLLRTVPGAQVMQHSNGSVQVLFARCRGTILPRPGVTLTTGTQLFINGLKVQDAAAEVGALRLSDIEAIAVYRGPSELPADAVGDGCAAIYVRTTARP